MNQYEIWKNHPNLDAKLRAELDTLNEKQIEDAFYTNIEFGTAGMRGLLGVGCNRINVHTIRKANQGFANYINANGEEAAKRGIAIGYDNRHMSYEFAMDSAKMLAKNGIRVYQVKPEIEELGITDIQTNFGNTVRAYDMERTICDVIRYKEAMDVQVFQYAMKEYMGSTNKNLNHLMTYAKKLHIEFAVRTYTEVML